MRGLCGWIGKPASVKIQLGPIPDACQLDSLFMSIASAESTRMGAGFHQVDRDHDGIGLIKVQVAEAAEHT